MSKAARNSEEQRQYMLETPVPRLICTLAVPAIVTMLISSLYNMADTFFVSQIGTSATGAVGVVFSIMTIIQAMGFTVGMGSGSLAAQLMGQGRTRDADEYASSAVAMGFVCGLLVTAFGLLNLDRLLWAMGATETIFPYAKAYARFILLGAPIMVLSFVFNNLLRWQGKANRGAIGMGTGGILNIILDPVFIFVFDMGIAGAALATLISQCVGFSVLASFFIRGESNLALKPECISKNWRTYLRIFKSGMPSFLRQGVAGGASMALNRCARVYGDPAVAAMAIVTKVFLFIISAIIGFGHGFQPVVGYNYGAGRLDRVRYAAHFSLRACAVALSIAAVIGYIWAPEIVTCFRNDPEVIAIGTRAFRWQCLTLPMGAVMIFSNMFFQAMGKFWRASFLAVCKQGVFFIPLVTIMTNLWGLDGLVASQSAADFATFLCSGALLLHFFMKEMDKESGSKV